MESVALEMLSGGRVVLFIKKTYYVCNMLIVLMFLFKLKTSK
jgi:hypothetical protein